MFKGLKEKFQQTFGWRYSRDIDEVIETLHPLITEYVDWYAERGLYLPENFKSDPSAWTNILRKIQRAFDIALTKEYSKRDDLESEMKEGFELFGKYFIELWK